MCGIAGILDLRGNAPIDPAVLDRMTDAQARRGPDGRGVYMQSGVGLGHRRLSIIDLEGGAQPLASEDGGIVVTFNGEIYNFIELRRELESYGHRFRTRSDTEVLVHAWKQWGAASVSRLNGMFAYALWERATRKLFLARDRIGEKPLYYSTLANGQFIFGSELKVLLAHPQLSRALNPEAVEDFFALGYIPDPKTILLGVHKLPPGTTLCITPGGHVPEPNKYWDIVFEPTSTLSDDAASDELVSRLRAAVQRRMISDVPLGAFLSGGVDSSAIVSQMAVLSDAPVSTCSVSFGDPAFNESRFAAMVAERYRTNHAVEQVDVDDFALIGDLVDIYDEPFADSSSLPTVRVCELARKRVKVVLSGDAGDEALAGYRRYRWHMNEEAVRSLLPLGIRKPVFGLAAALYPKMDWAPRFLRAKATLQGLGRSSVEAYFRSVSALVDEHRRPLYSVKLNAALQGYSALEVFRAHAANGPASDPLALVQYIDIKSYLPGDILVKVDRASMWNGLEVRVPMLDHEFLEWAATLPSTQKLRGAQGKFILKKAMEQYLPHEVMYRPKMGFAVPVGDWFRGPLRDQVRSRVLGPTLGDSGLFDMGRVRHLVEQHLEGRMNHGPAVWALLMFEGFCRRVLTAA